MAEPEAGGGCPSELLMEAVGIAGQDDAHGLARTDQLLEHYPTDARLHFLRGSLLAASRRYDDARASMAEAVRIAPGYAIARFQLGLLQLSSGDAVSAEATWAPLDELAREDPLRLFANGLVSLARDQFDRAADLLRRGIARNRDNPALNADMQLILDQMKGLGPRGGDTAEPTSAAQALLQQAAAKATKH